MSRSPRTGRARWRPPARSRPAGGGRAPGPPPGTRRAPAGGGPAGSPTACRRRPSTWPSSRHRARSRPGRVPGRGRGHDGQGCGGLHPSRQRPGAREPPDASAVAPGTPASSACPSRGPRVNSVRPCSRSAAAAGRVPPSGPSTRPIPHSGPNACASGTISPALPDAGAGHGRHDARVEEVGQPLAQRADTPASPDRKCAAGRRTAPVRRPRPATAAPGRPGQQQVALVLALLRLGEPDAGERAHAGVHPVHRHARAEHRRACRQRCCTARAARGDRRPRPAATWRISAGRGPPRRAGYGARRAGLSSSSPCSGKCGRSPSGRRRSRSSPSRTGSCRSSRR